MSLNPEKKIKNKNLKDKWVNYLLHEEKTYVEKVFDAHNAFMSIKSRLEKGEKNEIDIKLMAMLDINIL